MRYIILAVMLTFAAPAMALDEVQEQLKATPEMSKRCTQKIEYYGRKIEKYEAIPKEQRRLSTKIKLGHYRAELQNWIGYCTPESE